MTILEAIEDYVDASVDRELTGLSDHPDWFIERVKAKERHTHAVVVGLLCAQDTFIHALATRIAAASEVLSKVAERRKAPAPEKVAEVLTRLALGTIEAYAEDDPRGAALHYAEALTALTE